MQRERFPFDKIVAKKVGNARVCGSQRRAAGVPEATRKVLYIPHPPQVPTAWRQNCGALRNILTYGNHA